LALSSTTTITVYYYYLSPKLIRILPSGSLVVRSQDLQTAALFAPLLNGAAYGSLLTGTGGYPAHHRPQPPLTSITYGLSASSSGTPSQKSPQRIAAKRYQNP